MTEDLYITKLAWFKQSEKPEVVLLVADNPERIKIVLAWTNLNVKQAKILSDLGGESEIEIWDWLWENARFSREELVERVGILFSQSGIDNKMKPLIGNRILYPDGTVNSFVQRYLREQVVKLFETKPKHPVRRS